LANAATCVFPTPVNMEPSTRTPKHILEASLISCKRKKSPLEDIPEEESSSKQYHVGMKVAQQGSQIRLHSVNTENSHFASERQGERKARAEK
jgi:hypothetical protein